VSADPLAVHSPGKADLNVYAYVHGRVLVATDPTGLADPSGAQQVLDKIVNPTDPSARAALDNLSDAGHGVWNAVDKIADGVIAVGHQTAEAIESGDPAALARIAGGLADGLVSLPGRTADDLIAATKASAAGDVEGTASAGFSMVTDVAAAEGAIKLVPKVVQALPSAGELKSFAADTRGGIRIPPAALGGGATLPTITIIGRMHDLEKFAEDSTVDTWAKSGRMPGPGEPNVTWAENKNWIEDRIARGDTFGIATDPASLPPVKGGYVPGQPNGYFTARELELLHSHGIDPIPMHGTP
jgi:hypothetical protein